jgi:linoleoyl-CoA desaturase
VVPPADARIGQHLGQQGYASHERQPVKQIEHHLFPDLPSNRYYEIAPKVWDLSQRYGLTYHVAPLPIQVASALHKVVRLSLPNGWLEQTTLRNARPQIAWLFQRSAAGGMTASPAMAPSEPRRVLPPVGLPQAV